MTCAPNPGYIRSLEPRDIPGLVSFWNFDRSGVEFQAQQGEPHVLRSATGELDVVEDPQACGGTALVLREGQWLSIPRAACPRLDIHGKEGQLTLVAWIRRDKTEEPHCEFIAGQWNESNLGRQYGLFLNINVWQLPNRVFGHISNTGGPTPGYQYCMDGAQGATPLETDRWAVVGMSYDGHAASAWLDGQVDAVAGLNPYPLPGGLHDGGPGGSDFTVGAVDRAGEMGNFFAGRIAALAVYDRVLGPAEMSALARHTG